MQTPAIPATEGVRLEQLVDLAILDTLPEQAYDDIVQLASSLTGCPISLVSLVDTDRQWFKARVGLDAPETSRDVSFCAHAINKPDELFVVEDAAADPRFADNPLVTGDPTIRFYAGAPLRLPDGEPLGTLCVIDRKPRVFSEEEREALAALGRLAVTQLELRRSLLDLERELNEKMVYERALAAHRDELEEDLVQERIASHRDELTGVLNRRGLARHGRGLYEVRQRTGRELTAVMFDIDRFKQFNDTFGHAAGDDVLRQVAAAAQAAVRSVDLVGRFGGEEFVVLSPAGIEPGMALADRIRTAVSEIEVEGRGVTVSVGVAALDGHESIDDLIASADQALYRAKDAGRDHVMSA